MTDTATTHEPAGPAGAARSCDVTGAPPTSRRFAGATHARVARALLATLVVLATIAALGARSGGYIFTRTTPVALAFAGLVVAGVWLVRRPERPSRAQLVGFCAFAAFVAWTGLSVLWSVGPDLSWVGFDVAAFYLLVAVVCGALPGGRAQLRFATYGLAIAVIGLAGYALLGKIAPDVVTDAHTWARLSGSIGYWNVLAVLIVMVVPIALEAASRMELPDWTRGLSSSALVILFFTLFFTFSRGGFLALAVALLVFFALATRRLSRLLSLVVPAVLVAAVLYHLRHLGTLFNATTNDALRTSQGHTLAGWVVAAAVAAFAGQALIALAQRQRPLRARTAQWVGVAVLVVVVAAPLCFAAYYLPRHGGFEGWFRVHYHEALSSAGPGNSAGRLVSLGSSERVPWYREAIKGFDARKLAGTGAGTFSFTNYLYRPQAWVVHHSHSQWLNVLSELGLVGFVLFAVAIGGLVVAALGRLLKDRADPERSLLAGCQAAVVVFVVHMSIDWDWDMAVITLAFLLLAGAAAGYVRQRDRADAEAAVLVEHTLSPAAQAEPASPPAAPSRSAQPARSHAFPLAARILVTGLVVLGAVAWGLPYLSQRAALAAVDDASLGRLTQAASSARRAGRLDPLAVDPLITLALVQVEQRHAPAARQTLERAVRLQPRNYEPYYQMGLLELNSFGDQAAATQWFRRALALDPLDALTRAQLAAR